jgi:hypothetical protein
MSDAAYIHPEATFAILLGGEEGQACRAQMSAQDLADSKRRSETFAKSAAAVRECLCAEGGLQLPPENVLWLFDDGGLSDDQCRSIEEHLDKRKAALEATGQTPRAVIVYFVGHGEFIKKGGKADVYHFILRNTRPESAAASSLPLTKLLGSLRSKLPGVPYFLVIDACHAGRALDALAPHASPDRILAAERQEDAFVPDLPPLALLCTCNRDQFAQVPPGEP